MAARATYSIFPYDAPLQQKNLRHPDVRSNNPKYLTSSVPQNKNATGIQHDDWYILLPKQYGGVFLREISSATDSSQQTRGPLVLTWFNFNPSMDK